MNGVDVTRHDLLARARELVPALRERAAETERMRRIHPDTHRDFIAAGLYGHIRPERYGGHEFDYGLIVDIAAELGRGCGSSAWVFAQMSGHNLVTGMRPEKAQDEVWGANPEAVVSSSFPTADASATPVDGGVLLDGTWNFASGVDVADWNEFNVFLPRDDGPAEHRFCLVPAADYEVVDDWFVAGLAGTGSKATVVRRVFVPEHRTLASGECKGGPTPGSAVNPGPLYRLPLFAVGAKLFTGTVLGCARGALEAIEEDFRSRVSIGGIRLADQPSVQMRIAEAEAELDAAWALQSRDARLAMRFAEAGEQPPLDVRVRWRRNDSFAVRLCLAAAHRLQPLAGGRGLATDSPFQRAWRDIHAAAAQTQIAWDPMAINFGRMRFGLSNLDPRI